MFLFIKLLNPVLLAFMLVAPLSLSVFSVAAAKIGFSEFCPQLSGQWQGNGAKVGESPRQVTVTGICSHDQRQLILSVSLGTKAPYSETWWFRQQGEQVLLTYFDGISSDKQQAFSLYEKNGDFSLLGEGIVNARPALIQLLFQSHPAQTFGDKSQGREPSLASMAWQWTQNIQYLDDDVDRYQLFRGIEMMPAASSQ